MTKRLSGKTWFEAIGRSDKSRGVPRSPKHYAWPEWAQQAYMRGRMLQMVDCARAVRQAMPTTPQGKRHDDTI